MKKERICRTLGRIALILCVSAGMASAGTVNLDQLANGGTSDPTPGWQNGSLNGGNSTYKETKSVPFRYFVSGLANSTTHFFTIQAAWTDGGKHTYDYFTTVDQTEAT